MAAPLVVAVPAILSALWTGLVICCKWLVDHAHIAKIVTVCILISTSFWMGRKIYVALVSFLNTQLRSMANSVPHGVSSSLDILAKANYCLPVSEMLALLSVYVSCWGLCMTLRFVLSMYRSVPFKNA